MISNDNEQLQIGLLGQDLFINKFEIGQYQLMFSIQMLKLNLSLKCRKNTLDTCWTKISDTPKKLFYTQTLGNPKH